MLVNFLLIKNKIFEHRMRTFAAAAIMAASASAFDVMAAPDFVAGFIYGMTGDNHLTEIEACYNGGYQIVKDS